MLLLLRGSSRTATTLLDAFSDAYYDTFGAQPPANLTLGGTPTAAAPATTTGGSLTLSGTAQFTSAPWTRTVTMDVSGAADWNYGGPETTAGTNANSAQATVAVVSSDGSVTAFAGTNFLKSTYSSATGVNDFARGRIAAFPPSSPDGTLSGETLREGHTFRYSAAFYFPVGTQAKITGGNVLDFLRWDDFDNFGSNAHQGGLSILGAGGGIYLFRDQVNVGGGFAIMLGPYTLPEGRWVQYEVVQTLSRTDGVAYSAVYQDGSLLGTTTSHNMYSDQSVVNIVRFGLVAIQSGSETDALTVYTDSARVDGRMPTTAPFIQPVPTAAGSLTLSGTASAKAAATATGSLNLSGTATATAPAAAAGSLTLSGTATAKVAAAATGSLTLTGTATSTSPATALGSLTLSGTAAATAPDTATGTLTLGGSATPKAAATATGTLTLGGTATGTGPGNTATGSLTLSGTSTATASTAAAGSVTLTGTATATAVSASLGTVVLAGALAATAPATATGSLALTGSVSAKASAATPGSLTLSGTAATPTVSAAATGSLTISGTPTAAVRTAALGSLTLAGTGSGLAALSALGLLTLTGTAVGINPGQSTPGSMNPRTRTVGTLIPVTRLTADIQPRTRQLATMTGG
jgi:hypothetical protein